MAGILNLRDIYGSISLIFHPGGLIIISLLTDYATLRFG